MAILTEQPGFVPHSILPWTEQRENAFSDRYARRTVDGQQMESTPSEMWKRVADALATDEDERLLFYHTLSDFKLVPAGRVLSGAGVEYTTNTLYNCFVIGLRDVGKGCDSRSAIMDVVTRMVEITARGGGVGINWSTLRPRGTRIRGVDSYSTGSVSWMGGADRMVDNIRQGGTRSAALMYIIDDWHPDVMEFAASSFLRANHSVAISSQFMGAVKRGGKWPLVFPDTTHPAYDSEWDGNLDHWYNVCGRPIIHYGEPDARDIWKTICESAHRTGNPGLVFLERANLFSNTQDVERLIATNPCGEQILPKDGSCNLAAINLVAHYSPESGYLDTEQLGATIWGGVRLMDRVIDVSVPIDDSISDVQKITRRIGMGTMGLADYLLLKGVRYGSDESIAIIHSLYSWIRIKAYEASVSLAREKGAAPGYSGMTFLNLPYIKSLPEPLRDRIRQHGIRNMTLISQAPTGTTSILAGVSSGIEPIFASEYQRRDATGETHLIHPLLMGESENYKVTAMDISPDEHIRVQAAIQEHCDNAISKTINLPAGSTPEDISHAYLMAYEEGCKGITVFVSGSRDGVLELECPTGECDL